MALSELPLAKIQQLMKRDNRMFTTSDDTVMMKQIEASHAPDGRVVDVKPILLIIEDIIHRATPPVDGVVHFTTEAQIDAFDDKTHRAGFISMLEALAYTIQKISCELSCKCMGGGDAHAITLSLFNMLSSYPWEAKVVITLAAFAVNYGEFWLVAQLCTTNQLAKSVALLKQLPDMLEHSNILKPRFDALRNLIKAILDVTKCIVDFKELPRQYITADASALSTVIAHIPTAVYWTMRSIVASASQIVSLIGLTHEYISSTSESWELSSLAHKLNNIHGHLTKQLGLCLQHVDERRRIEAYQTLVRLFETIHIDNMKILKALIYAKDDILPLVDGSTKRRVLL